MPPMHNWQTSMAFGLVTYPFLEQIPEKNRLRLHSGSANVLLAHRFQACGSTVYTWQEHMTEEATYFMKAKKCKRKKKEAKHSKFLSRAYLQMM